MGTSYTKPKAQEEHQKLLNKLVEFETKLDDVRVKVDSTLSKVDESKLETVASFAKCEEQFSQLLRQLEQHAQQATQEHDQSTPKFELNDEFRETIKKFMMQNYNISWINDSVEEDAYDMILDVIFKSLKAIGF